MLFASVFRCYYLQVWNHLWGLLRLCITISLLCFIFRSSAISNLCQFQKHRILDGVTTRQVRKYASTKENFFTYLSMHAFPGSAYWWPHTFQVWSLFAYICTFNRIREILHALPSVVLSQPAQLPIYLCLHNTAVSTPTFVSLCSLLINEC